MRVAWSSLWGVVLLVAAPAAGAEESAPLESTKQELRQLESTQKNKRGPAVPDRVRLETPTLDVRGAGSPSVPLWTKRKEEEERARQQKLRKDENWLVNGVERLSREGTAATTPTGHEPTQGDALTNTPDPADPQYLLKLFDEQEKHSTAKEAPVKARAVPAPDPFAPFLQDWLGTSPVRNQVMDQFRKGGALAGATAPTGGGTADYRAPAAAGTGASYLPLETTAPAKENPYLVDSSSPIEVRDVLAGTVPLPSVEQTLPRAVSAPVTMPPPNPLPDIRAPAKGPAPSPADDKKYFPQLNRF